VQLWEAGRKLRALHDFYRRSPERIIPAVLAAWGLIQGTGRTLAPEEQSAVDRILENVPKPW
jgi:hypothetical protein